MIRTLLLIVLVVLAAVIAFVFAYMNPGTVSLDLAFAQFDEVQKAGAFVLTLAVGWILGALSASLLVLRLVRDRRKLRRDVRLAEAEADNLRSLPLRDGG